MARVIYLKPATGRPVALVQCDLLSGSLILHHRVAELIALKTDIDAGGLVISATHTHSAPGNYFGNMFYNKMASNSSGFDNIYLNFLTSQISNAVIRAYESRRPAKIATGTTEVRGVASNRSLPAYYMNNNIRNMEKKPDEINAVNPYLHMIRIDCLTEDGKYKPAGAFTNFSLHPSSNPVELGSLYNGDIFAFIERDLEWHIKHRYKTPWDPVHALVNYTHGDNNPAYPEDRVENFKDLHRLGRIIERKAFELFVSLGDRLTNDPVIQYRALEFDVFRNKSIDGITIADRPVVGMVTASGAQGRGRSTIFSYIPFFAPGWPRFFFTGGDQGHKRYAGGPLQFIIFPKEEFPHYLLLQVIQVGESVLLPLPFEVTYEMGMRIASLCREKWIKSGLKALEKFIVTSVSNGYWGYLTTPEEYSLQYYEGGSNLYGPNTGNFLAAHLGHLIEEMALQGTGSAMLEEMKFEMDARSFYPEGLTPEGSRLSFQHPLYNKRGDHGEPYWSFKYYDVPANLIELHKKLVTIEVYDHGELWKPLRINGIPVDDSGYNISIHYLDEILDNKMACYEVRWYCPLNDDGSLYRFAIHPRKGQAEFHSAPFNQ